MRLTYDLTTVLLVCTICGCEHSAPFETESVHLTDQIAFLAAPIFEDVFGSTNLYLSGSDTLTEISLTARDGYIEWFEWSPDGTVLAFDFASQEGQDLFLVSRYGANLEQITNDRYHNRTPAWSPDGKRIAFTSECDYNLEGSCSFIRLIDIQTRQISSLVPHEQGIQSDLPIWSPDGNYFIFRGSASGTSAIWIMNSDGTGRRPLVHFPLGQHPHGWSPDSRRVLLSALLDFDTANYELFTIHRDGSDLRRITNNQGMDMEAEWAPDGSAIVFSSGGKLIVTNPDGSNQRPLGVEGREPAWSADGNEIVFAGSGVFVIDRNGRNLRRVNRSLRYPERGPTMWFYRRPIWSPR